MHFAVYYPQIVSTLSALILFSSFILLIHRRLLGLINMFALQSLLLVMATFSQALILNDHQIYFSASLTFLLKVLMIPWFLRYLIVKLKIQKEVSSIAHPFFVLLGSFALVIFCYYIIAPITLFPTEFAKSVVVIAMSVMLLGILLMIIRSNAISHVIGFMVMENGLFFATLMSTQGMPMVVELGVAFDLLVAVVLFGVFFFHIRSSIESMDVDSLNRLREDVE